MNSLRNNKYIGWVVILLAILNIALLAFIWTGRNQLPKKPRRAGIMVFEERLNLNETQKRQLKQLRDQHFAKMEKLRSESRETRKELHGLWAEVDASNKVTELSQRMGTLHAAIEKATFDHFAQIRAICSPEQQKIFDELIKDVLRQGERPGPPNGRKPRGGQGPEGLPPSRN
ncbi:Spy/CpxP family protein refolding chaperone [Roseivirga sp. E12]|uniref:Spy/CpxP family protein refolding chaperone n=1 Tax=Roseivirga sp. E12 TaxID=2819237 RepID=UPI001ABC5285|nr:Spy/CpxP family protein refolding chaperone [Roseivirga sp. E12]MBO3699261.1 Spy/CpxP family protein refolding chaperone [Roseivirga sp. E12]